MGRYLSAGIATTILVSHRYEENILDKKEELLNQMKNFLDIQNYDIYDQKKGFYLQLKPEVFDENIHEFVKEFHSIKSYYNIFLERTDTEDDIKEFTKEKYPIKLFKDEKGHFVAKIENLKKDYDGISESDLTWENFSYILLPESNERRDYEIYVKCIPIWMEVDKTLSEDPTNMLYFLNLFSRNYFKNKLARHFLFFIEG